VYDHWSKLTCSDPQPLRDQPITDVRAEMLSDCSAAEVYNYKKKFVGTRPIKIRTIEKFRKRRQDSIKLVWFVQSRVEDIAYFNVLLRPKNDETYLVNETVTYLKRDYIFNNLPVKQSFVVCIFPTDSYGKVRENFGSDCNSFFNAQSGIQFDSDTPTAGSSLAPKVESSSSADNDNDNDDENANKQSRSSTTDRRSTRRKPSKSGASGRHSLETSGSTILLILFAAYLLN